MLPTPYLAKLRADVQAATESLTAAQAALFEHLDTEASHPEGVSLKEAAFRWRLSYEGAAKRCQRNPHLYIKLPDGRWLVPVERL